MSFSFVTRRYTSHISGSTNKRDRGCFHENHSCCGRKRTKMDPYDVSILCFSFFRLIFLIISLCHKLMQVVDILLGFYVSGSVFGEVKF